jgi:hypothetical protein
VTGAGLEEAFLQLTGDTVAAGALTTEGER